MFIKFPILALVLLAANAMGWGSGKPKGYGKLVADCSEADEVAEAWKILQQDHNLCKDKYEDSFLEHIVKTRRPQMVQPVYFFWISSNPKSPVSNLKQEIDKHWPQLVEACNSNIGGLWIEHTAKDSTGTESDSSSNNNGLVFLASGVNSKNQDPQATKPAGLGLNRHEMATTTSSSKSDHEKKPPYYGIQGLFKKIKDHILPQSGDGDNKDSADKPKVEPGQEAGSSRTTNTDLDILRKHDPCIPTEPSKISVTAQSQLPDGSIPDITSTSTANDPDMSPTDYLKKRLLEIPGGERTPEKIRKDLKAGRIEESAFQQLVKEIIEAVFAISPEIYPQPRKVWWNSEAERELTKYMGKDEYYKSPTYDLLEMYACLDTAVNVAIPELVKKYIGKFSGPASSYRFWIRVVVSECDRQVYYCLTLNK